MGLTRNERGTCRAGTHLPVDMAPALCPLAAAPYRSVSQPHSLPHGAHGLSCPSECSPSRKPRAAWRDFLQRPALPGPPCGKRPYGSGTRLCQQRSTSLCPPRPSERAAQLNFVCKPTSGHANWYNPLGESDDRFGRRSLCSVLSAGLVPGSGSVVPT